MHCHKTKFAIGEIVYLRTDQLQLARMVIAITIRPNNDLFYELASGADSSFHYEIEINSTVDERLKLGLEK